MHSFLAQRQAELECVPDYIAELEELHEDAYSAPSRPPYDTPMITGGNRISSPTENAVLGLCHPQVLHLQRIVDAYYKLLVDRELADVHRMALKRFIRGTDLSPLPEEVLLRFAELQGLRVPDDEPPTTPNVLVLPLFRPFEELVEEQLSEVA